MENHRTTSQEFPGWYVKFQAALITHAPRPGDGPGQITQDVALGWADNGKSLKLALSELFFPTDREIVDCNTLPRIPFRWNLIVKDAKHNRMGMFSLKIRNSELYANGKKIVLYSSESQKNKMVIKGTDLFKELEKKLVLNACFRDYLATHQWLIPESWGGKKIYFWGTIFCDEDGNLLIPFLYHYGSGWDTGSQSIKENLGSGEFAAVIAV